MIIPFLLIYIFNTKLTLTVDMFMVIPLTKGILSIFRLAFSVNLMSTEVSTTRVIFPDQAGNLSNGVFVPSGTFMKFVLVDTGKLTDPGIRSQPFCVP